MNSPPDYRGVFPPTRPARTTGAFSLAAATVTSLAVLTCTTASLTSRSPINYLVLLAALAAITTVLIATFSAPSLIRLVRHSVLARITLGIDTALLAATLGLGLAFYLVLSPNAGSLPVYGYAVFGALSLASCSLAVFGIMIAIGAVQPTRFLLVLRSARPRRTSSTNRPLLALRPSDLTLAGWCVALITAIVTLAAGIPLAIWLYGGFRPAGLPNLLLALPIIGIGIAALALCVVVARLLGLRLIRP